MVFEMAVLKIDPANATAFEAAVAACAPLFQAAQGCRAMALESTEEDAARYVLRVEWDTIEDHMVGFRESPEFQQWRMQVGGFFVEPPMVTHHHARVFF
ncbi:MAG: antibiotic biosynthesis monooxygenase [Sphingomonas sp.]|uniref:antibiotic biosynthesis monooxygenase family protein n=1 Tax=Sphingomonas sp. TaxID=28214 RepID=UPI00263339BD|nr:antibiotic biosynthesis monooxygenase [Sphingomonas sp.]MDK2770012.1 antibiotic biosynthesis monooxygenase [Sphingomonas sp.]